MKKSNIKIYRAVIYMIIIVALTECCSALVYADEDSGTNCCAIAASTATFVHESNPDKTGTEINNTTLIAGRGRETFLDFDLSTIDKSRLVDARLYFVTEHGGGATLYVNNLPNCSVSENVTYNTKPNTSGEVLITSFKTNTGNRTEGTYSRNEIDVKDYVLSEDSNIVFHLTGDENSAVEFASNNTAYLDRKPMLFITYGEPTEEDYKSAVAEADSYFVNGVSTTGVLSEYKASNGITVDLKWSNIRNNTIADEKASYSCTDYLNEDGTIVRPEWYEGVKQLKCSLILTAGSIIQQCDNVSISIQPKTAATINSDYLTDFIDIGNTESETVETEDGKTVKRLESIRDNGEEVKSIDGNDFTYRSLNKNGAMVLNMKCDSEKTNYLTVKLWGDDTGDSILWVCDATSGNMNVDNGRQPTRNGLVDRKDWIDLNCISSSPQYNGGFIYSTYMIPKIYTEGKKFISLRIYSTGGSASYGSVTVKDQTAPSRGIYAAYMTTDSNFVPEEYGPVVGEKKETAVETAATLEEQKNIVKDYAYDMLETFKNWQIYGGNNYPSYMEGMVTRGTSWKKKSLTDTNWKSAYYSSTNGILQQNLTPMNMYEIFAQAYLNADKLGVKDADELLDRIVVGIDFLVRAQGSNGGFFSNNGWIGGPYRIEASGNNLSGYGLRSVAESVILTYKYMSNYMEQSIDSDADEIVDSTRKNAWEQMFANARDYLVSIEGTGHAPNQDMANIIAAVRFEKALQLMNSNLSWKAQGLEDEIENELDIAFGFRLNKACSSYWVSPKGLILENFGSIQGGYSGDYGIAALAELSQLADFAEDYYGSESAIANKYINKLKQAYDVSSKFMFTANADDGATPTLYSEGVISNRNGYYPGTERYVLDFYSAEKGIEGALKTYDYFFKHNKLIRSSANYQQSNTHYEDNALDAMYLFLKFDDIQKKSEELNIYDYSYPMEDKNISSFAWADEMARNVVIKNGEEKIYIALNWRNPMHSVGYYNTASSSNNQKIIANNIARVHDVSDNYDRYGYAELTTEGWNVKTATASNYQLIPNHYMEAFMYMKYGNYSIVMNSNNLMGQENNTAYDIPTAELELDGLYKEMISGKYFYFGDAIDGAENGNIVKVNAGETMVLYKTDAIEGGSGVSYIDYDGSSLNIDFFADENCSINAQMFIAEYDSEGFLIGVAQKNKEILQDETVQIGYQKKNADSRIKGFVWNEKQEPIIKAYIQ